MAETKQAAECGSYDGGKDVGIRSKGESRGGNDRWKSNVTAHEWRPGW